MIFAHGPAGFLTSFLTKPFWKKRFGVFRKRTTYWLMAIGALGGIFPDIDLFYYYLVDAGTSHRAFLTHTPVLYVSVFILLFPILLLLKKAKWAFALVAFTLGALSHLATDTIMAQIRFLYPLSNTFYGISDFNIAFINSNLLFLNFLMEGIFFTFFFYALIRLCFKRLLWRVLLIFLLICSFLAGLLALTYANQHVYHSPYDVSFGDMDNDGIMNGEDRDMDGDGVLNIDDLDSDNDGISNIQGIAENSEQFANMWYDPTNGGLIQIPARLGLITNDDLIRRMFSSIGIQLRPELVADYEQNPTGYALPPTDSNFDRSNMNIRTWLEHRGVIETDFSVGRHQIGDVLFFENGQVTVVTGFNDRGQPKALDVHKDRSVEETTVDVLVERNGALAARAKVLHPTAAAAATTTSETESEGTVSPEPQ